MVNVDKYTIHGSYGLYILESSGLLFFHVPWTLHIYTCKNNTYTIYILYLSNYWTFRVHNLFLWAARVISGNKNLDVFITVPYNAPTTHPSKSNFVWKKKHQTECSHQGSNNGYTHSVKESSINSAVLKNTHVCHDS